VISLRAPDLSVLDARAGNGDRLSGYASAAGRYYLRVNDASATTSGQGYLLTVSTSAYPPEPTPLYPVQEYDLARTQGLATPGFGRGRRCHRRWSSRRSDNDSCRDA
jgi:hypothetical protein